jgi:hypothetical protein
MKLSGLVYAPASISPVETAPVPIKQEAGRISEPVTRKTYILNVCNV